MERSFTLGELVSVGAVGLFTGFLIAHSAFKPKSASKSGKKESKESKSEQKKTTEKENKSKASTKQEKIEEDSEEYQDDDEEDEDEFTDEDSEDEENEDLAEFDLGEEYKMVLVVRSDLGMGKGKAAAQCCHATLANYKELAKKSPKTLTRWEYCGQAKVTLKVDNEDDMLLLQAQARSIGLAAHSIRDAGRTQIAAGSRTVLAVGPGPVSVVDSVTGKLKLY
ncbi:Peptidyl-tRNA hydrolase protein 2, mitochondrial [Entomortierella lignicola]|nr:Peptidyl-tRNA hydrolase protein 2, mitochondrial [Entomortierella lignicola]